MNLLMFVGAVVLIALCLRRRTAYRHWRGPTGGTMDEVQREHLRLFLPDPESDEGDEV